MKVVALEIDISNSGFTDTEVEGKLWHLLGLLHDTRQIVESNPVLVQCGSRILVQVTIPEADSLTRKTTGYVQAVWQDIERLTGEKISIRDVGERVDSETSLAPQTSSFYVLIFRSYTPLLCGDSGAPIPLYRIPPTDDDGRAYDSIRFWENCYERLHGLWLGSGVGEAYALRQMQDHNSELSRQGRQLCARIEELTGTPTYYHLFNYRSWSRKADRARLCPETGMPWFVEGASESDLVAFKSDKARLVSELSTNCRY
jgi:predicted  nucleic acid-binding Zn ribbon protein